MAETSAEIVRHPLPGEVLECYPREAWVGWYPVHQSDRKVTLCVGERCRFCADRAWSRAHWEGYLTCQTHPIRKHFTVLRFSAGAWWSFLRGPVEQLDLRTRILVGRRHRGRGFPRVQWSLTLSLYVDPTNPPPEVSHVDLVRHWWRLPADDPHYRSAVYATLPLPSPEVCPGGRGPFPRCSRLGRSPA